MLPWLKAMVSMLVTLTQRKQIPSIGGTEGCSRTSEADTV